MFIVQWCSRASLLLTRGSWLKTLDALTWKEKAIVDAALGFGNSTRTRSLSRTSTSISIGPQPIHTDQSKDCHGLSMALSSPIGKMYCKWMLARFPKACNNTCKLWPSCMFIPNLFQYQIYLSIYLPIYYLSIYPSIHLSIYLYLSNLI